MSQPKDHSIILSALPSPDDLFTTLLTEVSWETMLHRGGPVPRLIAVQGTLSPSTNAYPLYRHPADSLPTLLPFTPTVAAIRDAVQASVGGPGTFNHVLIQHYRGGADYISEHSDKTLDILRGSTIVNVSLGARRTMTLRPKKELVASCAKEGREPPEVEKIPLPHGSIFCLGPISNKRYQHGIKHDNRPMSLKTAEEQAFNGERISLTFRCIDTFLAPHPTLENRFLIYGQGATSKDPQKAALVPVSPSQLPTGTEDEKRAKAKLEDEISRVIRAFGEENFRADSFVWDEWYGSGFDVVHFS